MVVQILGPETHAVWDAYVNQHPHSTCYHSRHWQTVAERSYKLRAPFLLARTSEDGPCIGVLPTFIIRGVLNTHMTNGLFGAYGAILAECPEVRVSLVEHAREICQKEKLNYFMLKTIEENAENLELPGFDKLDAWVIATVALHSDPDQIWHGLKDKTRNMVRKALRHNLEVRTGIDQLKHFYDVLSENMHDKGSPIYGYSFMKELATEFGDQSEVITLWKDNKAVSGALLLYHGKTVYVPFASSRPSSLPMSPNNLLYWEIIRRGCLRGMDTLDFGRSLKDSGPLKFKLAWGAVVQPQPAFCYSTKNKKLKLDPEDPLVSFFIRQWRRLPRGITNAIGPSICKQLAGLI